MGGPVHNYILTLLNIKVCILNYMHKVITVTIHYVNNIPRRDNNSPILLHTAATSFRFPLLSNLRFSFCSSVVTKNNVSCYNIVNGYVHKVLKSMQTILQSCITVTCDECKIVNVPWGTIQQW